MHAHFSSRWHLRPTPLTRLLLPIRLGRRHRNEETEVRAMHRDPTWAVPCSTTPLRQASLLLVDHSIPAAICQHTTLQHRRSSPSPTISDIQSDRNLHGKARPSTPDTSLARSNGSRFVSPASRISLFLFSAPGVAACPQSSLAKLIQYLFPLSRH